MDPKFGVEPGTQQHTISCTECQRRKQKCSRQWPCNHCQARKVPHVCHFASKKPAFGSDVKISSTNGGKKRKEPEQAIFSSPLERLDGQYSAADAFKAFGYLQSDGDPLVFGMLSEYKDEKLDKENEIATKEVPPRIYCDAIVQNYMDVCNYWYYPIYPPQFLESYNRWWENRATRKKNKPEFTCLLLRVLSNSTQCVHPALRVKLETELGESLQELTQKYHDAAERLSNVIKPGVGGIAQVQQLFLTAVWLKSECLFIDAWHALGDAIRYAQEVGIHNEALWDGLTEFDCEIRRRLWTTLYIWDRFMGMMLSRPLLINDRYCSVKYPSVNLEYDPAYPDLPCPHKHMELQQRLCQAVIGDFDGSKPTISVDDALTVIRAVNRWLDTLHPVYRLVDTDTRYDATHKYLKLQRLQTVCMGYSSIVSALKTFLTQTNKPEPKLDSRMLQELQGIAIEKCLQLMDIAQQLADLYIPDFNKYFLIVFTPFDTSALLCSAIIHDTKRILPRRNDILKGIAQGLSLLRRLAHITKTGSVAESVITSLVFKFSLTQEENAILYSTAPSESPPAKRIASTANSYTASEPNSTPPLPSLSPGDKNTTTSSESTPSVPMTTTQSTPDDPTIIASATVPNSIAEGGYAHPSFSTEMTVEQMANFDFGPLGPVFDWSHVNLFEENQHAFQF
ncbi:uncharacterized protein PV09_06066 [Verruconis gallopava]|uniref:Zn(2)-C6 fungal-type domain-containing protein n=1 Tax=Verruconis gallopava TaxID=253628 RepID=A0A0D1XJZ2_9PEZI|nr:uncharacterized protein PV09_06066 [Verruconis gallopava]KIW02621.1 hypothetical protein PV09_06066 [Verruconis gallopava]